MKVLYSLRIKIILWLVLIITLFIGILQAYQYHSLKRQLVQELNYMADQKISRLVRDLSLPLWELDNGWIDSIIETEMREPQVQGVFVYEEEKIISAQKIDTNGNKVKAIKDHLQGDFILRIGSITHSGVKIGEVKFYLSKTLIQQRLSEELYKAIFFTLLLSILVSLVLGFMIDILIIRPINTLLKLTEHIAHGDYTHFALLSADDEIGELGKGIDAMKRQIQKRENQLEQSLEELDRFFTVSLDLLCIADMEGNFLRLNSVWSQVLGYSLEELYHHKFFDFVYPEDIPETQKAVEQLIGQEMVIGFVNRYRTKEGNYRWLEWRSVPQGKFIYAAAHDITESILQRKNLEEANETLEEKVSERTKELHDANQQLQELDKLKSMFIASMSHELRTPLNSIIGFTGVLLQGLSGPLNEKQSDQLRRVKSAGTHLLSLISDVIDISKIEAGRVEPFPETFLLNDLMQEAFGEIEILAKQKGLSLRMEPAAAIEMFTDKKRLYQCLLNYLSNAVKFTEAGEIVLSAKEEDAQVRIWVQDSGIGIAQKDKGKLFEAFERLETHLRVIPEGTGLGLYLTRKITESLLQGSVNVESEEGKGSIFGLVIPKKIVVEEEVL